MAFNQGVRVPKNGQNPPYESFLESRGFRPEIQGLRAFAVLLVVVYHVWVGKVSGGVDVFLFISAFLLCSPSCGRSTRVSPSISSTTGPTCSPACYPQLRS